jgi:hypothetical protein
MHLWMYGCVGVGVGVLIHTYKETDWLTDRQRQTRQICKTKNETNHRHFNWSKSINLDSETGRILSNLLINRKYLDKMILPENIRRENYQTGFCFVILKLENFKPNEICSWETFCKKKKLYTINQEELVRMV